MTAYAIESDGLFWSSSYGWTDLDNADLFTYEEHMSLKVRDGTISKPFASRDNGAWVCLDMEGVKL